MLHFNIFVDFQSQFHIQISLSEISITPLTWTGCFIVIKCIMYFIRIPIVRALSIIILSTWVLDWLFNELIHTIGSVMLCRPRHQTKIILTYLRRWPILYLIGRWAIHYIVSTLRLFYSVNCYCCTHSVDLACHHKSFVLDIHLVDQLFVVGPANHLLWVLTISMIDPFFYIHVFHVVKVL